MTEEKVPLGQTSVEDMRSQESIAEGPSAQSSIIEVLGWRNSLEGTPSQMPNVEEKEPAPSGWNLSLEDFKQVMSSISAIAVNSGGVFIPLEPGTLQREPTQSSASNAP